MSTRSTSPEDARWSSGDPEATDWSDPDRDRQGEENFTEAELQPEAAAAGYSGKHTARGAQLAQLIKALVWLSDIR